MSMRPLHWVVKSADLRVTVDFYARALGHGVLRHEEFGAQCEAACNGRFGGAWSKTIVGPSGEETDFCLELVFNYGVERYSRGNAFQRMLVGDVGGTKAARARELAKDAAAREVAGGDAAVLDPDGNEVLFVREPPGAEGDAFFCVSLGVRDLAESLEFYTKQLRATVLEWSHPVTAPRKSRLVRFGQAGGFVELVELGVEIVQGDAQGRFATETDDGVPDELARSVGPEHVIHGPLQLPPHNERVVVITDLDKNEFAFVERKGYANCIKAGARSIDWNYRDEFIRSRAKKPRQSNA